MDRRDFLRSIALAGAATPLPNWAMRLGGEADTWSPESFLLASLDKEIPRILKSLRSNGQFGREPWVSTDQNRVFPLAAAWSLPESRYHHSPEVLDAILRGGNALIDAQDKKGRWIFRKKDNSTWGMIHQPWTYSRWIRAYSLVGESMNPEDRNRWDRGLRLGYAEIARRLRRVHNMSCHHAMGLYCAGQVFDRADWRQKASRFMRKTIAEQSPYGWWSEHVGPVVSYNFIYTDALGVYYRMSGDQLVLAALERAARFHAAYTYPDGSSVETVDERNPYSGRLRLGNAGFSHTPAGRGYLKQQHRLALHRRSRFSADYAAGLLLYGSSGSVEETAAGRPMHLHRMGDNALIVRRKPWFISLSAFACEIVDNRWIQDRQNFISVFHDEVGLVTGGGNTKVQPLWSNFIVGNQSLLSHTPGDPRPDFGPKKGLIHVPDWVELIGTDDRPGIRLRYGEETCSIVLDPLNDRSLKMVCEATSQSGASVEGHVTLVVDLEKPVQVSTGESVTLGDDIIELVFPVGGWVRHSGWQLSVPKGSGLAWPARRHNPARKGGESRLSDARMVVRLPFSKKVSEYELQFEIL